MSIVSYWLYKALEIYWYILVGRLIFEWIPVFSPTWRPRGALLVVAEALYTLTDPPLRLVRRVVPPVRIGTVTLDLSFLVILFVIVIAQRILINL